MEALVALAAALAQAGRWDDAHTTVNALPASGTRTHAFTTLVIAFTRAGLPHQAILLLADLWQRAQTHYELLRLFVVPPELLRAYPELGQEFLDSFAWVDAQLAVG